jgi:GNAT superfamily N-acetyltransferase
MVEADVESVIRCFESCYGRTYIESFYDPAWMREQIRTGFMRSVVCVDDEAGIVGHMALKIVYEGALACEAGSTVVDPAFRNRGLMGRMGRMITDLCRSEGFVGNVNEPTTAHDIMQRRSITRDGVETGIMLELIPATTEFHDFDVAAGRVAVTVVYQPLEEAPAREVFVPAVYRELVADLYSEIGLDRTLVDAGGLPDEGAPPQSAVVESISTQHRLRRLFVERVGADLAAIVDREPSSPVEVSQVDLCLDDPGVEAATKALRERGFFYCALQPEFARSDLLRLQRLHSPGPRAFSPLLANEGAKRLLSFMRSDLAAELLPG